MTAASTAKKTCTTVEEKSAYILRWLEEIVKHLTSPTSYKGFGVKPEDLDGLVEAGMQQQRLLGEQYAPCDGRGRTEHLPGSYLNRGE